MANTDILKNKKREYEWYEHDLIPYINDLKFEKYVENMDSYFSQARVKNLLKTYKSWLLWWSSTKSKTVLWDNLKQGFCSLKSDVQNQAVLLAIKSERYNIYFKCNFLKFHMKTEIEKDLKSSVFFIKGYLCYKTIFCSKVAFDV